MLNRDGVDNDAMEGQKDVEDIINTIVERPTDTTDGDDRARHGWRHRLRQVMHRIPVIATMFVAFFSTLGWTLAFGIPAICHAIAVVLFVSGRCWPGYRQAPPPHKSPLTTVCRVFVASAFNLSKPYPKDENGFYIKDGEKHHKHSHTRFLG